jgi:hypothetical protein
MSAVENGLIGINEGAGEICGSTGSWPNARHRPLRRDYDMVAATIGGPGIIKASAFGAWTASPTVSGRATALRGDRLHETRADGAASQGHAGLSVQENG